MSRKLLILRIIREINLKKNIEVNLVRIRKYILYVDKIYLDFIIKRLKIRNILRRLNIIIIIRKAIILINIKYLNKITLIVFLLT